MQGIAKFMRQARGHPAKRRQPLRLPQTLLRVEHGLVQAGVLEVHVRGSTIDHLDVCDRIVFDIDPGDGVSWAEVVAAARDVRERLAAIDLESFVKLTGGKGLHVVLPIDGADWDTAKNFAQAVAAGYEGIVGKDESSPYKGGRTLSWLKVKQADYRTEERGWSK